MIHVPPGEKVSAKATGKTKDVEQVICIYPLALPQMLLLIRLLLFTNDSSSQTFSAWVTIRIVGPIVYALVLFFLSRKALLNHY